MYSSYITPRTKTTPIFLGTIFCGSMQPPEPNKNQVSPSQRCSNEGRREEVRGGGRGEAGSSCGVCYYVMLCCVFSVMLVFGQWWARSKVSWGQGNMNDADDSLRRKERQGGL